MDESTTVMHCSVTTRLIRNIRAVTNSGDIANTAVGSAPSQACAQMVNGIQCASTIIYIEVESYSMCKHDGYIYQCNIYGCASMRMHT